MDRRKCVRARIRKDACFVFDKDPPPLHRPRPEEGRDGDVQSVVCVRGEIIIGLADDNHSHSPVMFASVWCLSCF